jgi:CDP-diacylglycerol--glycerol-3-phosphate 3-phosphatidyltransferase
MATLHGLKPRFQALLRPLAGRLARAGITANQVTVAAVVLAVGYGAAIVLTVGSAAVLLALPAVLLVRMGLNAIDGMIAREHGQESRTGAVLNELGDVVADAAIYLPLALALVPGFGLLAGLMAVALALTELAGILARALGGARRYDGPFGKSDRAAYFAVLAVASAVPGLPLPVRVAAIGLAIALAALTVLNRLRAPAEAGPVHG